MTAWWAQWWQEVAVVALVASLHPATTAVVRWGDDRTVRSPLRPRCVTDRHDLAWRDVVPLASWTWTRGRCRTCGVAVPWSLLAVEVGVVVVVGWTMLAHPNPLLLLLAPVAWSLVVATAIDLEHMIIPNRLTLPLGAWSVLAVTVLAWRYDLWGDWRRALVTGVVVPGVMLAMSLLFELLRGQAGMGMGDIKWAPSLGIAVGFLGLGEVVVFVYTTVLTAGIVAVALLVTGRAGDTRVPYGPYLAVGTATAVLGGDAMLALLPG